MLHRITADESARTAKTRLTVDSQDARILLTQLNELVHDGLTLHKRKQGEKQQS